MTNTFSDGANLENWVFHCLTTLNGATINVWQLTLGLCARISAIIIIVLPSPI